MRFAPRRLRLGSSGFAALVGAPRALADQGFLAAAARHIAEREHRASENGSGLQAPNRRHNLRTHFEPFVAF
jgi:hypothetical protein